jgi:putative exosortase-associated protein (TIGR04073 family)
MRVIGILLAAALVVMVTGCAGPEQKLGRGFRNATEFARFGEINRAVEQTALWDGPNAGYTTGFIRGFNRSVARTAIGVYEIVTFPIPTYDPLLEPKARLYPDPSMKTTRYPWGGLVLPENPVYPTSYQPNLVADSIFATDSSVGFSGGDVFPFSPGSKFKIFDH